MREAKGKREEGEGGEGDKMEGGGGRQREREGRGGGKEGGRGKGDERVRRETRHRSSTTMHPFLLLMHGRHE